MGVPVTSSLPADYLHRIYAGVLGKLIGVYLGRPFENWTYQDIQARLGPIHYYVHEKFNVPLVVIDDDVSGTFAFVRALEEHGFPSELTSQDIGKTWLNQVIEKKTIFWWGGNGISTEHTTFLNLKKGITPPMSGSIKANGKTLAEQIGAQIFIDGWAMVAPGNPDLAAKLAEAAARVSHDGVAVDAAVLWAAMEAEAFVSKDVEHLLETGLSFIPKDSSLRKLVADIRGWAKEDQDWQKTRQRIEDHYGYDKYGGICHMVPNHGIMIMALLYGGHSFSHAMHIINTCGWDTDCNSGNIGCLVAIMHGLEGFENEQGLDWTGPLADRAIISSADAGYGINDATRITYDLANITAKLAGQKAPSPPKDGAQFHFSLPGGVQGFQTAAPSTKLAQGKDGDTPALGIHIDNSVPQEARDVEVTTETFTPKEVLFVSRDYEMMASPLVYPGQVVKAALRAADNTAPVKASIRVKAYDSDDSLVTVDSEAIELTPGGDITTLKFTIPQKLENKPIQQLGLKLASAGENQTAGTVWLHSLSWTGIPNTTFKKPERKVVGLESHGPSFWQRAWVSSLDKVHYNFGPNFFLAHDRGEGLHYQGSRDWTDYNVTVSGLTVNVGGPVGVVARVQGLNRWVGVLLSKDENGQRYVALVKARDEERTELAKVGFEWELDQKYEIALRVEGDKIVVSVNGEVGLSAEDGEYKGGAAGFVVTEGSVSADSLTISPV
jgi:ADP-ribosylglycohydrolase